MASKATLLLVLVVVQLMTGSVFSTHVETAKVLKDRVLLCAGKYLCGPTITSISPQLTRADVLCIETSQVCDGTNDCPNGIDESHCIDRTLTCRARGLSVCADKSCAKICDHVSQCASGEDEMGCPVGCRCSSGQYQCADGTKCINACQVCNGVNDCTGNDDELNCPAKACPHGQYRCADDTTCIVNSRLCDGTNNCPGNDDEANCPMTKCAAGFYTCANYAKCLSPSKLCNGVSDCTGGEDEANCHICPPGKYRCSGTTLHCIDSALVCDGNNDCLPTNDDEANCQPGCTCSQGEYICFGGTTCIGYGLLCNTAEDCPSGEDEVIIRIAGTPGCPVV